LWTVWFSSNREEGGERAILIGDLSVDVDDAAAAASRLTSAVMTS
jgi:hypothetical protein